MLYSHWDTLIRHSCFPMLSNSYSYTRKVYHTAIPPHQRVYSANIFYMSNVMHQYLMRWLNTLWDKIQYPGSSHLLLVLSDSMMQGKPYSHSKRHDEAPVNSITCRPVSSSSLVPFPSLHPVQVQRIHFPSHCFYSVVIASIKTCVGIDSYINSPSLYWLAVWRLRRS